MAGTEGTHTETLSGGGGPPLGDVRLVSLGLDDLGELKVGGMGTVRRVRERAGLRRELAIKLVPRGGGRLGREELLTARLRHAGVVPVIDAGTLPDGTAWFTMPWIDGDTLEGVIARALAARRQGDAAALDGLIARFHRLCAIVGYAHALGVVHRDLKPSNVMVDGNGDVLVLDWGIALALGTADRPRWVVGTPAYMPPEQARGEVDRQGPATDVYALGAVLYQMLCGVAPHADGTRSVLLGPPAPVEKVAAAAGLSVPEGLAELCALAMAREPEDRPADAAVLADRVGAWREAHRRRTEASALLARALRWEGEAERLDARARRARGRAERVLLQVSPWEPEEAKLDGWRARAEAEELERRAEVVWTRFEQEARAALAIDPEVEAAHDALARRAQAQLRAAESRGDAPAAARALVLLERHARGERRALLRGEGWLTLHTDPPCRVEVERYERRFGRLEPVRRPDLDFATPARDRALPAGSYRLWLCAEGLPPVAYPVRLERGERWRTRPPGARADAVVELGAAAGLGPGEVLVPGGWTSLGGDPDASDAWPALRTWVDTFVIRRHPVTGAEYLAFLRSLDAAGQEVAGLLDGPDALGRDADGQLVLGRAPDGSLLGFDEPIRSVSWHAAVRYAAWEAARTGLPWRLPDEAEWEKAARGVDARRYPWGDVADGAWACFALSHARAPVVHPVEAFPRDESPYGVRGMGGNVRDWCQNPYDRAGAHLARKRARPGEGPGDPAFRMARGGSFQSTTAWCRAASRFAGPPGLGLNNLGVRLVRSG